MPVWRLDADPATGGSGEELIEIPGLLVNPGAHRIGRFHVSVGDLNGRLHNGITLQPVLPFAVRELFKSAR
jgi:hypothetical protein